jgi:hypothetical protein
VPEIDLNGNSATEAVSYRQQKFVTVIMFRLKTHLVLSPLDKSSAIILTFINLLSENSAGQI